MNYIDILLEAMSDFDRNYPGALEKIKEKFPTSDDIDEELDISESFRNACKVLVEPDAYLGRHIDMSYYYEKCENEGFDFVIGAIDCYDNSEAWHHIIKLVNEYGY